MKLKLDENLPTALAQDLGALGHDTDTVASEGLKGHDDPAVWAAAQAAGRLLLTQDVRLADIRHRPAGAHSGLLLVRLRQTGRKALRARVKKLFETEDVESWTGCIVVASDLKVRVRINT